MCISGHMLCFYLTVINKKGPCIIMKRDDDNAESPGIIQYLTNVVMKFKIILTINLLQVKFLQNRTFPGKISSQFTYLFYTASLRNWQL